MGFNAQSFGIRIPQFHLKYSKSGSRSKHVETSCPVNLTMRIKKKAIVGYAVLSAYFLAIFFYISSKDIYHDYLDFISVFALVGVLMLAARTKWLYLGITAIFSVGIGLEVAFAYTYGSRLEMGVLYSVLDTNMHESTQMLGTVSLLTLLMALATAGLLLALYRGGGLRLKGAWPALLLILLGFSKLGYLTYKVDTHRAGWGYDLKASPFRSLADLTYDKMPVFWGDALFLYEAYLENAENKHRLPHQRSPDGVTLDAASDRPRQIVIVIGEASFAGHYSSYGYARNTTPGMQRIFSGPNACMVKGVHSPAPMTRDALLQSLTFSTPHDQTPYRNEKNIVEMAKEAGYKTYWLSSFHESGFYFSNIGLIAHYSDFYSEPSSHHSYKSESDDLALLKTFKKVFDPNEKQVIILHLNGSHAPYRARYDAQDAQALQGQPGMVLDYDRSIHHTDRLVSALDDLLSANSKDYLLFYAPDHGEVIDPKSVAAAGSNGHGIEYGGVDQYEIPMMIKYSHGDYCGEVERYRGPDGYINAFAEHDLYSQFMGYSIGLAAWRSYDAERPYVLHSDEHVYRYPDLPHR